MQRVSSGSDSGSFDQSKHLQSHVTVWTINDGFLGGLRRGGKPMESQHNPAVLQLQSSVDERLSLAKRAHGNASSLCEWYLKRDANGSLTSCQICHILYYKAWRKITYTLAGRGFPVVTEGKRVEDWAIFDISILLLAVALGHVSARPQGREEKEKGRAETGTGE